MAGNIFGKRFSISRIYDNLVSNYIDITQPCADCSITVGAEAATAANVRTITVQLKDSKGVDIDYVEVVGVYMFLSSAKTAICATGGSTGLAVKTDGAILSTVVAKKHFTCSSESDGDLDFIYTDSATTLEAVCLGVVLPSGRIVTSSAFSPTN